MKKLFHCGAFLFLAFSGLTQNVGVGTNTPTEKLHVAGNLRADTVKPKAITLTTGAGSGKVLTSDAAGNASWQAAAPGASNANGNVGYGVWGDCQTNSIITEYQPVEDTPFQADAVFGKSVSISGNFAIVGAPYADVGVNNEQGSATIFRYNGSQWVFMQTLADLNGGSSDHFGSSVSISGQYAIVGAPDDDVNGITDQGSASVFKFNGTTWVFQQQLTDANGAASDGFGNSVSISGSNAIVGALYDDVGAVSSQGSACVFSFNGATWALANKLTAAFGGSGDYFGRSVAISGNYAVVGASGDQIGANSSQGSAKVYHKIGANWTFIVSLTDPDGLSGDEFGKSVAIDGTTILVGAPSADVNGNTNQGSACLFQYDGTAWVFVKKLLESDGIAFSQFGQAVSLSGDYALVGADLHDVGGNISQGRATLYLKVGTSWGKMQYITDPRGEENSFFGYSVAVDSNTKRFLIGAGMAWTGFDKANKAFFGRIF